MKRTNDIKQPDAIFSGDWHIREDQPVCRTDDYQKTQWKKMDYLCSLQEKWPGIPFILSGDLFNHWKPSPYLLAKTIEHLPKNVFTIYGNHDLPQHNLENKNKCGVYVLNTANKLDVLSGVHWGETPEKNNKDYLMIQNRKILIWHVMTYFQKEPYPGCPDVKANILLRKYPEYDVILTGHNHIPFVESHEGRILVNPGSITRHDADQIDFKPRVYLYYADENKVIPHYIPIEQGVVSREHLEIKQDRDERINAFVESLNTNYEITISLDENLQRFEKKNKVDKEIMTLIYKSIE